MWIRSQDKKSLVNVDSIHCDELMFGNYNGTPVYTMLSNRTHTLGVYKSEERALEVLDQIHNVVARNSSRDYLSGKYRVNQNYVFEMPKE
ncbi:hypothetical protein SAMN02910355_1882 [Terrisporobacter glycolicus]|nr:hypothetical protein SAMN02910355_1882 [Terrisporobacter glycolicus]